MNRQVVLEIGNTHIKAGFIEVSSLPLKRLSSWGKKDSNEKFFGSSEPVPSYFDDDLHLRALKSDQIYNFDFLIDLIENTMIYHLQVPKEFFEQVQLTLVLPSNLIAVQLPLRSKLIKTVYERLRVASVFLAEMACMAAAGSNHGTALVLNFDDEGIEVAAVNDFSLVTPAVEYYNRHVTDFYKAACPNMSIEDARAHLESVDIDHNAIASFKKVYFDECNEDGLNLINVIESVLDRVDPDRRSITLNHIILNGILPTSYPILTASLQGILSASSLLSVSDYPAETQPAGFAFRSIPEFYFEIKESGREHVAWFGSTITGKYAHNK